MEKPDTLFNHSQLVDQLPILGVCGWSNSGKTTLLETAIPLLRKQNLRVAVIKHDAHGLNIDSPGKDSDRLFKAGADVYLEGDQIFHRKHERNEEEMTAKAIRLARFYDLVLVEGHKSSNLPKIWLLGDNEHTPPSSVSSIITTMPKDEKRADEFITFLQSWIKQQWFKIPVYGCILIGGMSTRMGEPKHLLSLEGKTWLELAVEKMRSVSLQIVTAGSGRLPKAMEGLTRLPDPPGIHGPLAGMLAAMRWNPWASWIFSACDMPLATPESLLWLIKQRKIGTWAVLPSIDNGYIEPLLAYYDFRMHPFFENMAVNGNLALSTVAGHEKALQATPPHMLRDSWRNINSPSEREELL